MKISFLFFFFSTLLVLITKTSSDDFKKSKTIYKIYPKFQQKQHVHKVLTKTILLTHVFTFLHFYEILKFKNISKESSHFVDQFFIHRLGFENFNLQIFCKKMNQYLNYPEYPLKMIAEKEYFKFLNLKFGITKVIFISKINLHSKKYDLFDKGKILETWDENLIPQNHFNNLKAFYKLKTASIKHEYEIKNGIALEPVNLEERKKLYDPNVFSEFKTIKSHGILYKNHTFLSTGDENFGGNLVRENVKTVFPRRLSYTFLFLDGSIEMVGEYKLERIYAKEKIKQICFSFNHFVALDELGNVFEWSKCPEEIKHEKFKEFYASLFGMVGITTMGGIRAFSFSLGETILKKDNINALFILMFESCFFVFCKSGQTLLLGKNFKDFKISDYHGLRLMNINE